MTKPLMDRLDARSRLDQMRRVGVPKVVQADFRKVGRPNQLRESLGHVVRRQNLGSVIGEDVIMTRRDS